MPKWDTKAALYALRCAIACLTAYRLSQVFGLAQPLWPAMSATMVSLPTLAATRSTSLARVVSTTIGALISLAVGATGARLGLPIEAHMGVAVGLTALLGYRFPAMRPAIWTCPLVLLSGEASAGLTIVAWRRATEVGFGALVGWLVHFCGEKIWPEG